MKSERKKEKELISKPGLIVMGLLSIVIIVIVIIMYVIPAFNKKDNNKDNIIKANITVNTNKGVTEKKKVKELTFKKTSLTYSGGLSKLVTTVKNNGSNEYTKTDFIISVKDKNKKEIVSITGVLSSTLKPGESQEIVSYINVDLSSDAYFIEYKESE